MLCVFSSLHFKKTLMEEEKTQGWASEVIKGLEDWAEGKCWDLQSRGAEAKRVVGRETDL